MRIGRLVVQIILRLHNPKVGVQKLISTKCSSSFAARISLDTPISTLHWRNTICACSGVKCVGESTSSSKQSVAQIGDPVRHVQIERIIRCQIYGRIMFQDREECAIQDLRAVFESLNN